jgi:CheY-like chemotaxis protein
MARIVLIHWNPQEARERAGRLRSAGHTVRIHSDPEGGAALRATRDRPPDALVIDLSRVPSHGGAVGTWLRQQKATRSVPLLFVGGSEEKVARVRKMLPDATYTEWRRIRGALSRALKTAPRSPVVPGTMDGYSGTPLPRKLGIRAGNRVALLGAPRDFEAVLGNLPEGVTLRRQARGRPDIILLFCRSQADLKRRFPAASRALAEGGKLWLTWRKQASGAHTDLTQKTVREFGLASGFVDYKICSVDATWSGLCFSRRGGGRRAKQP